MIFKSRTKQKLAPLKTSSLSEVKVTLKEFRSNWRTYLLTSAVVMVPSSIIQGFTAGSSSQDYSISLYLFSLYATLAILWLALGRETKNKKISSYYVAASQRFLPIVAITIYLGLQLIPALVGVFLVAFGAANGSLLIILAIIGALLIVLSFALLVRRVLAMVIVIDENYTAKEAIKKAKLISKGRVRKLLLNIIIYFVPVVVLSGLTLTLVSIMPGGTNRLLVALINGLLLSVTVPIFFIYLSVIFNNINQAYEPISKSKK